MICILCVTLQMSLLVDCYLLVVGASNHAFAEVTAETKRSEKSQSQ